MDDKVFNLLEKMYAELIEFKQETVESFKKVDERFGKLENQVTKIEVDHGKKLEALFDGYNQNTKLLEDIRVEVARHEEVIIKRVK